MSNWMVPPLKNFDFMQFDQKVGQYFSWVTSGAVKFCKTPDQSQKKKFSKCFDKNDT